MTLNKLDLLKNENWHGVWTALITPLLRKNNKLEIDEASLSVLIENQIKEGATGLVIAGSTGEGSLLSEDQIEHLFKSALAIVRRRIPLVGGLGIGGTQACLKNIERLQRLGYQGALASVPAYIKAPQRGLQLHFLELARAQMPICLYEVASRAASSLTVETLAELGRIQDPAAKYLVALKDASGDMVRMKTQVQSLTNRFAWLTGDDGTYQGFLANGGNGVISVVSHVAMKEMVQIFEHMKNNRANEASAIQQRLSSLIDQLFCESNPIPVKSLLHKLGVIAHSEFCSPLVPMDPTKLEQLFKTFKQLG